MPIPRSSESSDSPASMPVAAQLRTAHRPRRYWRQGFTLGLLLLVVMLVVLGTAIFTPTGSRLSWQLASQLMTTRVLPNGASSELSGEWVGGTWWKGVEIRQLSFKRPTVSVKAAHLRSRWQVSLLSRSWHIEQLQIDTLTVSKYPDPAPSPTQLPSSLQLPLRLNIDALVIDQLNFEQAGTKYTFASIRLSAESDGRIHALHLQPTTTPWGSLQGNLRLDGKAPFAISASVGLQGEYQNHPYQLQAGVTDTLPHLQIKVKAQGSAMTGQGQLIATPFAALPFSQLQLAFDHLNPQAFNAAWPLADLSLTGQLTPQQQAPSPSIPTRASSNRAQLSAALLVKGELQLKNQLPGTIDQQGLPLLAVRSKVELNSQHQRLSDLQIDLPGGGRLQGQAEHHADQHFSLNLQASDVNFQRLHRHAMATRLAGPLTLTGNAEQQFLATDWTSTHWKLAIQADATPQRWQVKKAELRLGKSRAYLEGSLARDSTAAYQVRGQLAAIDPAKWFASFTKASAAASSRVRFGQLNATFNAKGTIRPDFSTQFVFKLTDSVYDQLPMTGQGDIQWQGHRLLPSHADLTVAGNTAQLTGRFGAPGDVLQFKVSAPKLARLGAGVSGTLQAQGNIGGTLQAPAVHGHYEAHQLRFGAHQVDQLVGNVALTGNPAQHAQAPLQFDLMAQGIRSNSLSIANLSAKLSGNYANHRLQVSAAGQWQEQAIDLALSAQGRASGGDQTPWRWQGQVQTLNNQGTLALHLVKPVSIDVSADQLHLGASQLQLAGATIDWQQVYYGPTQIASAGRIDALAVEPLLTLYEKISHTTLPIASDLILESSWDFVLGQRSRGFLNVARRSGDFRLPTTLGQPSLGLETLALRADVEGTNLKLNLQSNSRRLGSLTAAGTLGLTTEAFSTRPMLSSASPLNLQINIALAQLQTLSALAGPGLGLSGRLQANVTVKGRLEAPQVSGLVQGDGLGLIVYDQGLRLRDGILRLRLQNNVVDLEQLLFYGGAGSLKAQGRLSLDHTRNDLQATIEAKQLQLLASPSGQLTLSGQAVINQAAAQTKVTGKFRVDHALFNLPEQAAPKLDDDVFIVRNDGDRANGSITAVNTKPPLTSATSPWAPLVDVGLDLGNDFRFEGAGAALRLGGSLNVRSQPGQTPEVIGTVNVINGVYEAFGTKLAIERGVLNFQGETTNPNINLLAMRRTSDVSAGVQITGSLQRPRVQLVSEPTVSDEEKLSWLLFGRAGGSTESGQAQAAAQGAALGLLNKLGGQRVAQRLGLDALSIGESEYGMTNQQVVNLGKALTDRLYLGYEQSLSDANNVLKLTYELSRYWSVVLRGGGITGLDVLYNRRFDHFGQSRRQAE